MADYEWTEKVLETCFRRTPPECHGKMDGLSLHYYVHPEGWEIKGSATEFDDDVFYKTLSKAWYMDELIRKHGTIMDKYDPEKRVGMIVDEWGAWYTVEPGTNPASSTSRTPCGTHWWPVSPSISSTTTATG